MEPGIRVSIYEPPGNLRCGDVWCSKCQSESSISFHFTSVTLRQRPGEPSATGNRERNGVDKDITERERGLNSQRRGKMWHPSGRPTSSFLLSLSLFFIMPLCGGVAMPRDSHVASSFIRHIVEAAVLKNPTHKTPAFTRKILVMFPKSDVFF